MLRYYFLYGNGNYIKLTLKKISMEQSEGEKYREWSIDKLSKKLGTLIKEINLVVKNTPPNISIKLNISSTTLGTLGATMIKQVEPNNE